MKVRKGLDLRLCQEQHLYQRDVVLEESEWVLSLASAHSAHGVPLKTQFLLASQVRVLPLAVVQG